MLDVNRLRVIDAVARHGSVTAAAKELHYAATYGQPPDPPATAAVLAALAEAATSATSSTVTSSVRSLPQSR